MKPDESRTGRHRIFRGIQPASLKSNTNTFWFALLGLLEILLFYRDPQHFFISDSLTLLWSDEVLPLVPSVFSPVQILPMIGTEISGVVGYDFLQGYKLVLDYNASEIRLIK